MSFNSMSKNKLLNQFAILFLLWTAVGLSLTSCQEDPTPAEMYYLDTLQARLKGTEMALQLNENELSARKDEIRERWIPSLKDTTPDIRAKLTDDYQGMISAYDLYLSNYLLLKSGQKILEEDLQNLRNETAQKALNRDEFKQKYQEIEGLIRDHEDKTRTVAKPVYDLEAMWMRMKRQFPEVKTAP